MRIARKYHYTVKISLIDALELCNCETQLVRRVLPRLYRLDRPQERKNCRLMEGLKLIVRISARQSCNLGQVDRRNIDTKEPSKTEMP